MSIDLFGPASAPGSTTARPSETRAFGGADTFFKDCSSPTNDDGTEFQAAWFNALLANVRSVARGNGQTGLAVDVVSQDNTDDAVILKAIQHLIQRGQMSYAADTSGSANAVTIALSPAPAELKDGLVVRFKKNGQTSTGAAQIVVNSFGAVNLMRGNGGATQQGDLVANMPYTAICVGGVFYLLGSGLGAGHGQCRLTLSGGNLLLSPANGNTIVINGGASTIPAGGITLAPGGLSPSTFYYIYAQVSGSMSLVASTTGHSTASNGVETMTGDTTKTLVGAAYVTAGAAFADADGQRYVISWFNRKRKNSKTNFTTSRSTSSPPFVELNAEIRNGFITWADEVVGWSFSADIDSTPAGSAYTAIGFDGTTPENPSMASYLGGAGLGNMHSQSRQKNPGSFTENAVHYATVLGGSASTATWYSGNSYAANLEIITIG